MLPRFWRALGHLVTSGGRDKVLGSPAPASAPTLPPSSKPIHSGNATKLRLIVQPRLTSPASLFPTTSLSYTSRLLSEASPSTKPINSNTRTPPHRVKAPPPHSRKGSHWKSR